MKLARQDGMRYLSELLDNTMYVDCCQERGLVRLHFLFVSPLLNPIIVD